MVRWGVIRDCGFFRCFLIETTHTAGIQMVAFDEGINIQGGGVRFGLSYGSFVHSPFCPEASNMLLLVFLCFYVS